MRRLVFNFDLDGKTVLGFDTDLDARAFAQTKMAQFISQPGYIVFPGSKPRGQGSLLSGRIETWHSKGVTELENKMIIWGSFFPGEELSEILLRQSESLDALRFWLKARIALEKSINSGEGLSFPGPAGAFIVTASEAAKQSPVGQASAENNYPVGTVFFPPVRLLKRTLDAGGTLLDAQRWTHPDLKSDEEISFSAGTMLYHIFCNNPPFYRNDENELREDIREGVFVPPQLAAPGLDPEMAKLINEAISPETRTREAKPRPDFIMDFIGSPGSRQASSWVKALSDKEIQSARLERDQYKKRTKGAVKTRRFLNRNTTAIAAIFIVLLVSIIFTRSLIRSRAELPNTMGMTAIEVVKAYYQAFNTLDHAMMQASVSGRAGRNDIQTATSLFVVLRVRQAHESTEFFMPASEWLEAGQPETGKLVFGITDLTVTLLSESESNAVFEAAYVFWTPAANEDEENLTSLPRGIYTRDIVTLAFQRDAWRITDIERRVTE